MNGRWNRWTVVAYAHALVVALCLGYFIAGNHTQINDGVSNLLPLQNARVLDTVAQQFLQRAYLRPLLWLQLEVSFDLARALGDRFHEVYKTIHVGQVLVSAVLLIALLRVRTFAGVVASMLGLAMLFGAHTFAGTVYEGYPINTFLTIVVCCLAAGWLSFGEPARWRDVAAALLFAGAALTVESGLLVWVVVAAAWLAGERGISRRGVIAITGLFAGYFVLRFALLDVGTPALIERSSGYGFQVLEREALAARFADGPYVFYAYNVVGQICSVLFAEPRNGVFAFTRDALGGALLPRQVIGVAAQAGATLLIAGYAATRIGEWRRGRLRREDRLLVVFAATLAANAVISYPYSKDVVMSPAGAFHSLAAAVALERLLAWLAADARRLVAVPLALTCCLLSALWVVKLAGIHYALRNHAFIVRNDWAEVFTSRAPIDFTADPAAAALVAGMQRRAITARVPPPYFAQPLADRYFELPW